MLAEEHVRHATAGTRLCSLVTTRILHEAFSTHLTVPRVWTNRVASILSSSWLCSELSGCIYSCLFLNAFLENIYSYSLINPYTQIDFSHIRFYCQLVQVHRLCNMSSPSLPPLDLNNVQGDILYGHIMLSEYYSNLYLTGQEVFPRRPKHSTSSKLILPMSVNFGRDLPSSCP